jgi:hypothetical protein
MREDIRQWTSVVDSLSPDVSVKYNVVTGLPMKFSANALELLLDMVVDRLRGTTHDGGTGTARLDRLREASAPFTGELECATRRYAACISVVHAGSFSQQTLLLVSQGSSWCDLSHTSAPRGTRKCVPVCVFDVLAWPLQVGPMGLATMQTIFTTRCRPPMPTVADPAQAGIS